MRKKAGSINYDGASKPAWPQATRTLICGRVTIRLRQWWYLNNGARGWGSCSDDVCLIFNILEPIPSCQYQTQATSLPLFRFWVTPPPPLCRRHMYVNAPPVVTHMSIQLTKICEVRSMFPAPRRLYMLLKFAACFSYSTIHLKFAVQVASPQRWVYVFYSALTVWSASLSAAQAANNRVGILDFEPNHG